MWAVALCVCVVGNLTEPDHLVEVPGKGKLELCGLSTVSLTFCAPIFFLLHKSGCA